MKRIIFLPFIIFVMLLSACNSDSIQDIPENSDSEQLESYTTGSYQLHFSESLAANEASAAEESENAEAAQTTAPEETEDVPTEITSVSTDCVERFVDTPSIFSNFLVGDNLMCAIKFNNGDPLVPQTELEFIDINDNKVVNTVSLPPDFSIHDIYTRSENVLMQIISETFDNEKMTLVNSAAIIYDDFTIELIDDPTVKDICFEHYGHKISDWGTDIVCLDSGEPETIVAGSQQDNDEWGFFTRSQAYMFPIDENRFVYRTYGYESLPGFGIYDFRTNTAKDVPGSENLIPKGIHDGKIYSAKGAWDGFGREVYVTDIENLETSFFMDFPYALGLNETVSYYMPESGKYILILFRPADILSKTHKIYIADADTGEIKITYNIPEQIHDSIGFFIGESFAITGDVQRETKLIIFDFII